MATDDAGPAGHPRRRLGARHWPRRNGHPVRDTLIGAGLAAYAWIAGSTAPFSGKALVSVIIPGAVLGVIAYGRPPERIPAPDQLDITGASYWLICLAAGFEWEASAFKDNSLPWHPSLTDLVNPLLHPHPVKSGAIFLWLLAGWGLVRR
jgi:hypothetical protein